MILGIMGIFSKAQWVMFGALLNSIMLKLWSIIASCLLPIQVIYAGKTPACLPKATCPKDWYLTYTENHWSKKQTKM